MYNSNEEIIIDYENISYRHQTQEFMRHLPSYTKNYIISLFPIATWLHRYNMMVIINVNTIDLDKQKLISFCSLVVSSRSDCRSHCRYCYCSSKYGVRKNRGTAASIRFIVSHLMYILNAIVLLILHAPS